MRRFLSGLACAASLAIASAASGEATLPNGLADRTARDLVQAIDLGRLADMASQSDSSDYPDLPQCAEIQKQSFRAELAGDQDLFAQAFSREMARSFSRGELEVGYRFLESPVGKEVIGAAYAHVSGQAASLSPDGVRQMRILGRVPQFRSFMQKVGGMMSETLSGELKDQIYPRWRQRFADMARAASVECPTRDWK